MSQSDNDKGLYNKYILKKLDGTPIDLNAKYFVLRYDEKTEWCRSARIALRIFAYQIERTNPQLSKDLLKEMDEQGEKDDVDPE